jgi:hypothetical protein
LLLDEYSMVAASTALYKAFAGARSRVALLKNMSGRKKNAKRL